MRSLVVSFVLFALVACYQCKDPSCSNTPPVAPDYPADGQIVEVFPDDSVEAASSPCGKACANLKSIHCPEGESKACYRACAKQASLETLPIGCWTAAATPEAARHCGQLRCSP